MSKRAEELAENIIDRFYIQGVDKYDGYEFVKEALQKIEAETREKTLEECAELVDGLNKSNGKGKTQ